MSIFVKSLIATAIPIAVLSLVSAAGRVVTGRGLASIPFQILLVVAGILWGIAILAAIGFAIARKRHIAAGILAGVGIGIVALGLSCFANATVGL